MRDLDGWTHGDVKELEREVDTDDQFECGHDSSQREFVVVPKSGGVNMLGAGFQAGSGNVKIGCTVCGELNDVKEDSDSSMLG